MNPFEKWMGKPGKMTPEDLKSLLLWIAKEINWAGSQAKTNAEWENRMRGKLRELEKAGLAFDAEGFLKPINPKSNRSSEAALDAILQRLKKDSSIVVVRDDGRIELQ